MRTFSREHSYDHPPEALLALWRDPEFLRALGAKYGGVGDAVIEEAGDRVRIRTSRELPVDAMPGFVRRFISSSLLEQVDEWPRELSDPAEGTWVVTGKLPAVMSGRQSIRSEGEGCVLRVEGSVKVTAPLIGGRAEEMISTEITKLLGRQQEFAEAWLVEHRTA